MKMEKSIREIEEINKKIKPACLDSNEENLDQRFYCKICGMGWYNCLCCHEDL